jgi:hypothetical protein
MLLPYLLEKSPFSIREKYCLPGGRMTILEGYGAERVAAEAKPVTIARPVS